MNLLTTAFGQILILFLFILVGYALHKKEILPESSNITISRIENYVLAPALVINTFKTRCTPENLSAKGSILFFSLVILAVCIALAYLLAPFFSKTQEEKGIFRYSICVTNFGFMGNALVQGIFGDEILFDYMIFSLPLNVFVYSLGIIWITAGKQKFSFKMFLNPMFLSLIIGAGLGFLQIPLPSFLDQAISSAAACYSPLAMILTGFVIGRYPIRSLFSRKDVYLLSVLRLIVIPLLVFAILNLLHAPQVVQITAVCAASMPLGLNTIVFPAAYGGDDKPGASMAMVSSLMGFFTIPILLWLLLPIA